MTTEYPEKTLVLAKVKGYPEWPACVVPLDMMPANMSEKKPKTRSDSVCVKFYFDDQYIWCSPSNMKAIDKEYIREYLVNSGETVPDGCDDFIDNQGGRRKRIVSAYLKAYTIPIDEFMNWGSWGPPKEPEFEEEEEEDEFLSEEAAVAEPSKKSGKGRGRPKRNPVPKPAATKAKRGKKRTTNLIEETAAGDPTSSGQSSRGRKKQKISIDIPIIDDEEDEDFVEGQDEFEEEDELDSDRGPDSNSFDEDGSDDEDLDGSTAKIDADWGIDMPKADVDIDFKAVPDSKTLNGEVNAMASWCWRIRTEIQSLLFPDDLTQIKDKQRTLMAIEVKRKAEEEANNAKAIQSRASTDDVTKQQDSDDKQGEIEQETKETAIKDETNNDKDTQKDQIPLLNYKAIKKSLDPIVSEILESDISKSVLRTSGLNRIILCVLKTPELQSQNVQKLHKWWLDTYSYDVAVDIRWSPTFTNEMHESEENERRDKEEEKRKKRKEERKNNSYTQTPDVEVKQE